MLAFLQTIVHILISLEVISKQPEGESTERNTNEAEEASSKEVSTFSVIQLNFHFVSFNSMKEKKALGESSKMLPAVMTEGWVLQTASQCCFFNLDTLHT